MDLTTLQCTIVCLLMVVSTSWSLETRTENFPSFDSVRIRASRLSITNDETQTYTTQSEPQAIFPNMKFLCNGTITKIWYIAKLINPSTNTFSAEFQVWSAFQRIALSTSVEEALVYMQGQAVTNVSDTTNMMSQSGVLLRSLATNGFQFQSGQVFGSRLSNSESQYELQYLPNSGPTTLLGRRESGLNSRRSEFVQSEVVNDLPLIAIETDHPECVEGFLDISVLETLIANVRSYFSQLRIIPSLDFRCPGHISHLVIGAKRNLHEQTVNLRIGLWNCTGDKTCVRVVTKQITSQDLVPKDGFPNVYIVEINSDVNISSTTNERLILGIEQEADSDGGVILYYQQGVGPINHYTVYNALQSESSSMSITFPTLTQRDLPLIYPVYRPSEDMGSDFDAPCQGDFINEQILKERALLIEPVITDITSITRKRRQITNSERDVGYQYFFPHLSFQTSGSLTSWLFGAESRDPAGNVARYPQFEIWRPKDAGSPVYFRINTTDSIEAPIPVPGELNMYEYNFDSQPLSFEQGDIVGIYQPPVEASALVVAFVEDEAVIDPAFRFQIQSEDVRRTEYDMSSSSSMQIGSVSPLLTVESIPPETTQTTESPEITTTDTRSTATTSDNSTTERDTTIAVTDEGDTTVTMTDDKPTTVAVTDDKPTTPGIVTRATTENSTTDIIGTGNPLPVSIVGIAGGAVGGVIALLILLVIILVVFILVMKFKRKTARMDLDAIENPEYSQANNDAQLYEIPISTNGRAAVPQQDTAIYQTVGETAQPYETPSISRQVANQVSANNSDNVYHILEPANGTGSQGNNGEKEKRHIYHTLEAPVLQSDVTDNGGSSVEAYEMSVIVPTGEQRQTLNKSDERDIYASLKVIQTQTSSIRSDGSFFEESEVYWRPASSPAQLYQQLSSKKYREIPRHMIQVTDHIGSGNFGNVNKGLWQTPKGSKDVAIKRLKEDASDADKVKFLQEAAVNGQFRHPNVVSLLGVVTIGEPVMIILELMENGDLRSYLNKNRPTSGEMVSTEWPQLLLGFCQHIAAGMDYLSKKGFVHRDLAARNILVTADKTCKVTDFGMSREIEEESYYVSKGGMVPVKWTAPEAIHYKKFSSASDVWSYGCVSYEVWSLGRKPFPKNNNFEAVNLVEEGYRLPPPPGCPREIYRIMIQCWHSDSNSRPTFAEILSSLLRPDNDELLELEEDNDNPKAAVLGSSLKFSKHLYLDLQNIYKSEYETPNVHVSL